MSCVDLKGKTILVTDVVRFIEVNLVRKYCPGGLKV